MRKLIGFSPLVLLGSSLVIAGGCVLSDYQSGGGESGGAGGSGGIGTGGMGNTSSVGGSGGEGGSGGAGGSEACVPGDKRDCYSGPSWAAAHSPCQKGLQACGAGSTWEACTGDVLPEPQDCKTGEGDLDCDGGNWCSGISLDTKKMPNAGATLEDVLYAVAMGGADNAVTGYVGGVKDGTMLPGGDGFGTGSVLLAKRGPLGNLSDWSLKFTSEAVGTAFATSVAVVPAGGVGVVVGGNYHGTALDVGGTVLPKNAADNGFVAVFQQNGTPVFAKSFIGASLTDRANVEGVAADESGNVYVVGSFNGIIDFAGHQMSSVGAADGFLVAMKSDGTVQWTRQLSGLGGQGLHAVAVTGDGVFVTGHFANTAMFAEVPFTSTGGFDVLVAMVDASGNVMGSMTLGGGDDAIPTAIAASGKSLTVAGTFRGSLNNAKGEVLLDTGESAPGWDGFIVTSTIDFSLLWYEAATGADSQVPTSVAFDRFGDVSVAGFFTDQIVFPGQSTNTGSADTNAFVVKLTGDKGDRLWLRSLGDQALPQKAHGIAAHPGLGHPIVVGGFQGTLAGGQPELVSNGLTDGFVLEMAN